MPRYYAKKEKAIDFDNVLEAMKQVKIHKSSLRQVSNTFKIPKTNLIRYIAKFDKAEIDVATAHVDAMKNVLEECTKSGKTIFNAEQEKALLKYILKASDIHYGLSVRELRKHAYEYAKGIGISYPDSWDVNGEASSDWQLSFMNRHRNLSLRTLEQESQNRAKSFCKENVDAFFKNLSSVLDAEHFEPHRIWNLDEIRLPTVPTTVIRVITHKGKKRVGTSAERGTNVTLVLSVSASGQSIPPFYLFPRQYMKDSYMRHSTHGAVGIAKGSGLMTSAEFLSYLHHFIKHSGANADLPTLLLLLDNHTAHLSIKAIELAREHGIKMLSFPPHCTHRMQPLDITIFGPLKTMYSVKHDAWKKSNVGVIFDLHHVPLIADQCLDSAVTPKNIKAGFRAAGIFPIDPHVFTEVDFVASELSGENVCRDYEDDTSNQRRIIVPGDDKKTGAHEEVTISEPSTSGTASTSVGSASVLSTEELQDALKTVEPLQLVTPAKKSNRGRKPMKSDILTSPEVVTELREKADKKRKSLKKKGDKRLLKKQKSCGKSKALHKKRPSSTDSDVEEDIDFCIICKKNMPKKMNRQNTIHCNECDRAVHLACARMTASYRGP